MREWCARDEVIDCLRRATGRDAITLGPAFAVLDPA